MGRLGRGTAGDGLRIAGAWSLVKQNLQSVTQGRREAQKDAGEKQNRETIGKPPSIAFGFPADNDSCGFSRFCFSPAYLCDSPCPCVTLLEFGIGTLAPPDRNYEHEWEVGVAG